MLGRWRTVSGRSRCSTFCTRSSRKRTGVQFSQKTQETLHSFLLRKCFVLFHSVWLQMEKHLSLKHGSPPFFFFIFSAMYPCNRWATDDFFELVWNRMLFSARPSFRTDIVKRGTMIQGSSECFPFLHFIWWSVQVSEISSGFGQETLLR